MIKKNCNTCTNCYKDVERSKEVKRCKCYPKNVRIVGVMEDCDYYACKCKEGGRKK